MTSHHDSHTTTDVKPEIIPGFIPEMDFHMINILYAALSMCTEAEKMTFSGKDDCTLMRNTRQWTNSATVGTLNRAGTLA